MTARATVALLGMFAALISSGCSSQNSGPVPRPPAAPDAGFDSSTRTYPLSGAGGTYALAPVAGFSGSLALAAASVPPQTTLEITSSLSAPENAPVLQSAVRHTQSTGTLNIYFYATIRLSHTVTYPVPPGFSVTLPKSVNPSGLAFFYAVSMPAPTNGAKVQYRTEGPATVVGRTVTFSPSSTPLTLLAGQKYTIVLYAVTTSATAATKIYVANERSNTVTTYNADGTPSTPTLTAGLNDPSGVALDAAGKIYVANGRGSNNVTTYDSSGKPSLPTIAAGLYEPLAIAVDVVGKIHLTNCGSCVAYITPDYVTTYDANGVRIDPTIFESYAAPSGVAVDASGKIYIANTYASTVNTYNSDGSPSQPNISFSVGHFPSSVAVDAGGKIYVTSFTSNITGNTGMLTTYNPDGTPSTPTITAGLSFPDGVAVDAVGKIYVADGGNNRVTTYDTNGTPSTPTITAGLNAPRGIAVR